MGTKNLRAYDKLDAIVSILSSDPGGAFPFRQAVA